MKIKECKNIKGLFCTDEGKFFTGESQNNLIEVKKYLKNGTCYIEYDYIEYNAEELIVDNFLYWSNYKYIINLSSNKLNIATSNLLWADSRNNIINIGYEKINLNKYLLHLEIAHANAGLAKYNENEKWRIVINAPYIISTYGRCISIARNSMEPKERIDNRVYFNLYFNGKTRKIAVDKLVAAVWIPNHNNFKYILHRNRNELDCFYKNLQWVKSNPTIEDNELDEFLDNIINYGYEYACELAGF